MTFTRDAAGKIIRHVREHEGVPYPRLGGRGRGVSTANEQQPFKVTSEISGQTGRYNGKSIVPNQSAAPETGYLAESDLGTTASEDDVIIWCVSDIAGGSNSLSTDDIVLGTVCGVTSDGKRIVVVQSGGGVLTAKITSAVSGQVGRYNAKRLTTSTPNATGNLIEANWGTLSASDDCIVWDRNQTGLTTARPLTGLIVRSAVVGTTSGGLPVLECASSVQQIRASSNKLQVAYLHSPTSTDWVDAVTGVQCS